MALELTEENIANLLSDNKLTVLDFWAPWCGPCRVLSPIIDEIADEHTDSEKVNVAKVNVDENSDLAVKYGIRGIPSILFIKDGNVVDRFVGMKTKNEIQEKINSLMN
jgi:thioredoxin 1